MYANQDFLVTLRNGQGQPVDGADVYLDLSMPTDDMGINRPVAEPLGKGVYRASSVFTMIGPWVVQVVATVDGREYRALFETDVVAPE